MSSKNEFSGDVGQAIFGNLNESPRLSNVVTLHVGEKEKPANLITPYQRTSIKLLVDELAMLSGDEDMKIYRGLITDYGLHRFKELPRSKYREVKATLEQRIDQASNPPAAPSVAPPSAKNAPEAPHHPYTLLPCLACVEKSLSFSRLQLTARIQLGALITCLAVCGWLLYKMQVAPAVHGSRSAVDGKCYIAGKAYSVGHIERSRGRAVECVGPIGDMPAVWLDVNRSH
ncbi:hypothetical protein P9875_09635 [Janthinobacterium rivuli]|uniref:Uncharacterized protein n=1 Tax=Janthinobacterium rivuli TaxID=2751478 RepID=A0ABY8IAC4_9BURK|nr:hypothetical protein [Janthinobacterium rivuli]WFR81399.1 hypothetical protein P9875_09635 [Janthinobacterium rivuli]